MEEFLYTKVSALIKRWRAVEVDASEVAKTAVLADVKAHLTIVARGLTGEEIDILPAEREGGWCGNVFYLPGQYARGTSIDDNMDFYLFRTCYLATQRALGINWPDASNRNVLDAQEQAACSAPIVLDALFDEYPRLRDVHDVLVQAETDVPMLYGRWMVPQAHSGAAVDPTTKTRMAPVEAPTTEREAPPRENVESLRINRDEVEEYTLSHSFEKVETIEEFQGTWRDLDGADELDEHADALKEVDLRQTVRTDDVSHSVLRSEMVLSSGAPESAGTVLSDVHVSYDEWDYKKREYRPSFCTVYPKSIVTTNTSYATTVLASHGSTLAQLRKQLAALHCDFEMLHRQPNGTDPDIDAIIDAFADIHAGRTPSENVYCSKRRRRRDLSLLLLMDSSLSTDAFTNGHKIIDVERRALLLFAQVLSEAGERFQIDTFSSKTRHYCEYTSVKAFDDPWVATRDGIGSIEPQGYTRIGPALRHAIALMGKEKARQRWIFLLTDGKPNDYDRYEGVYGIEDVRRAVREAADEHVHVMALAVESDAKFYLPRMFGLNGFRFLPSIAQLPSALAEFYLRLAR